MKIKTDSHTGPRGSTPVGMKNQRAAFTLVEVMVTVAILAIVLAMVYSTFFSVLRVTKSGADAAEQVQRERIALKTIEDAFSGIVYYEQNQERYAFEADTTDFDYPALSFVSRVPPDFLGSKKFGAQRLRRIDFIVEDIEPHGRSLVMYQTPILQPVEDADLNDRESWVLGPGLDTFFVVFWSTINNEWISEWTETNSVPTRLKFEMSFKGDDGSSAEITDIHKREIMIFSGSITQAQQNPPLPSGGGRGRGKGKGKGSSRQRFTPEQIAEWRKRQSQSSGRSGRDGRSRYTDQQRAEYRKRIAERFMRGQGKTKGKGRVSIPGGGDLPGGGLPGGRFPGGGLPGDGGNSGGSSPPNVGGGIGGGIPGQRQINDALLDYAGLTGQPANSLQDLVTSGVLTELPTPPSGMSWAYDPVTGTVRAVVP